MVTMEDGAQEDAYNQATELSPSSLRRQRRLQYAARKEARTTALQQCLLNQEDTVENMQPPPVMDEPELAHFIPVMGEGPPMGSQEPRQVRTFLPFPHALSLCCTSCRRGIDFDVVPLCLRHCVTVI
jgi:hypothetical protein